jgi:hypothetical protein
MKIKDKLVALGIILITGVILKLEFLFAFRIMRADLFYYIEFARTMLDGGVMYKDFGCSHPPLGYFEFYWMAKFFGYDNIYLTIKIVAIAIQTLAAFFIYLTFQKIRGHRPGIFFAVLFLLMISVNVHFWPHNIPFTCILPAFVGIYFLTKNDFQPTLFSFFLFGFFISCSTLISTNMALYALIVPVLAIKNHGLNLKRFVIEGSVAFFGFLVPIGLFALYFAAHDALPNWYHWNIVWASIYGGFKPWYMNLVHLFWGMILTWQMMPFFVGGFYVSYRIIKDRSFVTDRYANFALWMFILALAAKGLMNKPEPRYYLYMMPGLLFAASYLFPKMKEKTKVIVFVGVSLFLLCSLVFANYKGWQGRGYYPERANLRSWISVNIPKDKRIWVWDEGYEIYYDSKLKRAKNSIFAPGQFLDKIVVWKGVHFKGVEEQWSQFMSEFTANPPDYIVDLTLGFERLGYDVNIPREGPHEKWFQIFNGYVKKNYSVIKIIDNQYRILKLKKKTR